MTCRLASSPVRRPRCHGTANSLRARPSRRRRHSAAAPATAAAALRTAAIGRRNRVSSHTPPGPATGCPWWHSCLRAFRRCRIICQTGRPRPRRSIWAEAVGGGLRLWWTAGQPRVCLTPECWPPSSNSSSARLAPAGAWTAEQLEACCLLPGRRNLLGAIAGDRNSQATTSAPGAFGLRIWHAGVAPGWCPSACPFSTTKRAHYDFILGAPALRLLGSHLSLLGRNTSYNLGGIPFAAAYGHNICCCAFPRPSAACMRLHGKQQRRWLGRGDVRTRTRRPPTTSALTLSSRRWCWRAARCAPRAPMPSAA